jgi:UDP-glucose 4-epimerase
MNYLVRDRAVIFNLAGQVSHIDSMRDPYTDLEINCRSQLTVSRRRNHNADVKVVFAGTPGVDARPAPGRRRPTRASDRRQRHQQGRG